MSIFTHDASILPMDMYPMWKRRIKRLKTELESASYYRPERVKNWQNILIDRIKEEGPLSTKDFVSKVSDEKKAWARPPHKQVLDYLWYSGVLATSHRENFVKFYDLSERVIPQQFQSKEISDEQQIDWLCRTALTRLAVASAKEIKEFWEAKDTKEVKEWVKTNKSAITPVKWETATGEWVSSYAPADIEEHINKIPSASSRIRIVSPFDPVARNRSRLKSIFGFDYKLEVFVPASKRRWGYYVYPLLQGDRFVGRIEVKADRRSKCLNVLNFWAEDRVKWGNSRKEKLKAELINFARLAYLDDVKGLNEVLF